MITANYHTHTTWCDGGDDPEKVVLSAIAKGFDTIGFSSHSEMLTDIGAYADDIRRLGERYRGRIRVLLGLEADGGDSLGWRDRLDYVIGSVHFVTADDGTRVPVDHTPQILEDGIAEHFGGDAERFVRAYFAAEREMVSKWDFDIVGHLDLVRKFNAKHPYFDERADWYLAELEATADAVAASGKLAEVNTGAISRGWMDDAYPSATFRSLLRERGVRFILSSDSHAADTIDCAFDRFGNCEKFERLSVG